MFLLKFFFNSRFWLCYPRTHSFQLRFSPELKGFQVAGFFLAQLLLWKWFLLFIWSCEGKWSVIDCNSRLKTMFVCLLLLKVWNVVSICPQVTSLINNLCVASLHYQAHVHPYLTWELVKEYFKIFRNNYFLIWVEFCLLVLLIIVILVSSASKECGETTESTSAMWWELLLRNGKIWFRHTNEMYKISFKCYEIHKEVLVACEVMRAMLTREVFQGQLYTKHGFKSSCENEGL